MAKLQMKSGFTRRLKLSLILTLAHSVMKQLGFVEYINENVSWDPAHWERSNVGTTGTAGRNAGRW